MKDAEKIATSIADWLSDQKYGNEPLLHAAVCCDFVGRSRFIKALKRIIDGKNEPLVRKPKVDIDWNGSN